MIQYSTVEINMFEINDIKLMKSRKGKIPDYTALSACIEC